MTELALYKFVTENELEYHWNSDKTQVYLFVPNILIDDFNALLGIDIHDEEGIKCTMKFGYIGFEMEYICEYFDIELERIFDKSK